MTRSLVVGVLLLATGPSARSHDFKLSPDQQEQMWACRTLLNDPPSVAGVQRIRKLLTAFDKAELAHLGHSDKFARLEAVQKERLLHAARAIVFAETHRGLKWPWRAGLLLESPLSRDRFRALRVLSREPFTDSLDAVAVALSGSRHAELRLGAGRIAKLLTVFRGRNAAREAIGKRVLVDRVPNVAALFALYDAHDFESKSVVDSMIVRLHDTRELSLDLAAGLLLWPGTVAGTLRTRLQAEFFQRFLDKRPGKLVPVGALPLWWKENRDHYTFGADLARRHLALGWTGAVTLGESTRVGPPDERIEIKVESYEELWANDRPKFSCVLKIRWPGRIMGEAGLGPGNAEEGERVRGSWGRGDDRIDVEYFIIPDHRNRYRVRLRLWVRANEQRGEK